MLRMSWEGLSASRKILIFALLVLAAGLVYAWRDGRLMGGSATGAAMTAGTGSATAADPASLRQSAAAHFDAGQYDAAVRDYSAAAAQNPENASVWSALGEARVMASARDPMPAEALADFHRAVAIDAKDPRARYFLAVSRDLGGDRAGAIADWLALLADTPAGAPWQADLERTIVQVGKLHAIAVDHRIAEAKSRQGGLAKNAQFGQNPAKAGNLNPAEPAERPAIAGAIPGPTATDLQAANGMSPSQQRQMAEGMVARLEARLRSNPADTQGWLMLIRSRATLGQKDAASKALANAMAADPAHAPQLREQAGLLGVR